MENTITGFNGEYVDPISGIYHLGNGYRASSPGLMRFTRPDDLSPFGLGGLNPYSYCVCDPVNGADPTGHMSWQAGLGIALGIAGLMLTGMTAGASIAATGGIFAAMGATSALSLTLSALGVVSDVTSIASAAMEKSHPETSVI